MRLIDRPNHRITNGAALKTPRLEDIQVCLFAHMKKLRNAGIHTVSIATADTEPASLQPSARAESVWLTLYFDGFAKVGLRRWTWLAIAA
jgi:hypothetical protein